MVTYFNALEQTGTHIFGNMGIVAIVILFVFIIALLMLGLEFKWALLAVMPCIIAFTQMKWLNPWVEGIFWIGVIGFLLYASWTLLQAEYF